MYLRVLFGKMYLLCALLAVLSLCGGASLRCPGRCSCDSMQSVQCYRLTEVPSAIPPSTKRLYISHSKIEHLQVTMPLYPRGMRVLSCEG